jgi:hypothetical protein
MNLTLDKLDCHRTHVISLHQLGISELPLPNLAGTALSEHCIYQHYE